MILRAYKRVANGAVLSALLLALFSPLFAFAASDFYPGQAPAAKPAPTTPYSPNQADAFETAQEQAVFLGAYQMFYGPYGTSGDRDTRAELLKQTSTAIEDCISKRDCGANKQELVLKALVQYNMGQEIKRMMLTNSTNRENMRSLTDASAADPAANAINKSMSGGKSYSYSTTKNGKKLLNPIKTGGTVEGSDVHVGSRPEQFYQLDPNEVKYQIPTEKDLVQKEILGSQFLHDYSAFLDTTGSTKSGDEARFRAYKKLDAKETYVYDPAHDSLDPKQRERFVELQKEQSNPQVQAAVGEFKKSMSTMTAKENTKGVLDVTNDLSTGMSPLAIGLGETAPGVDYTGYKDVKNDDLVKDGKIEGENKYKAITRIINKNIETLAQKTAADEKAKARSPASNSASTSASASDDAPDTKRGLTVSLDPVSFDAFLDEIWPSAATRAKNRADASRAH